jgi:hypothetical protein
MLSNDKTKGWGAAQVVEHCLEAQGPKFKPQAWKNGEKPPKPINQIRKLVCDS